MKTTITITIPGSKAGEIIHYKVEINKSDFDKATDVAAACQVPSDILVAESSGFWKILEVDGKPVINDDEGEAEYKPTRVEQIEQRWDEGCENDNLDPGDVFGRTIELAYKMESILIQIQEALQDKSERSINEDAWLESIQKLNLK